MAYLFLALSLISLGVWIYFLFDVITTDAQLCRNLPKTAWVLIVLLLPKIGVLLWCLAGRPRVRARVGPPPPTGPFPEYDRPGRARAADPKEDEEFLRRCRERAEEQRRRAREAQEQQPDPEQEHPESDEGRNG